MKTKLTLLLLTVMLAFTAAKAQELEPTEDMSLFNISVTDDTGKPLEGEIISFIATKDGKVYTDHTNADGKFSILVPIGDVYNISYTNFTEEEDYSTIEVPGEKGFYTTNFNITFEPTEVVVLNNIEFDFGKATLRTNSHAMLNKLAEIMKVKSKMEIEIAGHTDNVGADEANLKLSQARAESVRNYLIQKGIDGSRIVAKGYGMSSPIAPNIKVDGSDDPEGRQKNRRIELKVTKSQNQ